MSLASWKLSVEAVETVDEWLGLHDVVRVVHVRLSGLVQIGDRMAPGDVYSAVPLAYPHRDHFVDIHELRSPMVQAWALATLGDDRLREMIELCRQDALAKLNPPLRVRKIPD